MLNYLSKLYHENRKLELLEVSYLIIAVAAFLIAAVIALFNQSLGVGVLIVPLIVILTFAVNIVTWSVVKFVAEEGTKRLGDKAEQDTKKAKK